MMAMDQAIPESVQAFADGDFSHLADSFANARARVYRAVDRIDFADGFHRRDIGWRELARENA